MAKTRLSKAAYVVHGYGQVEPNHLSARRTGQIYAQLPANKDIDVLENGQFAKYDYANKEVNFTGVGEWMLVFNEIKLYEPRQQDDDFAMIRENYAARVYDALGTAMPEGTSMVPRLLKTNVGDIFTTNAVNEAELALGDELSPAADGFLSKNGDGSIKFAVVKVYTMPDGQPGVKLQRIA